MPLSVILLFIANLEQAFAHLNLFFNFGSSLEIPTRIISENGVAFTNCLHSSFNVATRQFKLSSVLKHKSITLLFKEGFIQTKENYNSVPLVYFHTYQKLSRNAYFRRFLILWIVIYQNISLGNNRKYNL